MLKKIIIHPFLIAIYPVVFLYKNNIDEVQVTDTVIPIFINLVVVTVFLLIFLSFSNNKQQAAIEATILIFLFSTYGSALYFVHPHQFDIGPRHVFALYGVMLVLFTWGNYRILKTHLPLTEFLNIFSIVLIMIPVVGVLTYWLKNESPIEPPSIVEVEVPSNLPDIYYIILDEYGGGDMLSEVYDFDNTQFLSELEKKGFYVASSSFSNYFRTVQSLNSTLNISYLGNDLDWDVNLSAINNNYVNEQLKYFGYTIYPIHNDFNTSEWTGAEIFHNVISYRTPFFRQYISTTAVVLFWESVSFEIHRQQVLDYIDSIDSIVEKDGPKFVFAHVLIPHPPFVFDKDGNQLTNDTLYSNFDANELALPEMNYRAKYLEQLQFVNSKISHTVDYILEHSETPPIIIVQGDHGPGSMFNISILKENQCFFERYSILNAYYFPDKNYDQLYENISSVNTFRVVLSQYFGISYDMLDDIAYFAEGQEYFKIFDVTENVKSKICNGVH